jgi:trk system potassium uptake protein
VIVEISRAVWSPPKIRPVLYLIGNLLMVLAISMLLPAIADAVVRNPDYMAFLVSGGLTFACGAVMTYTTHSEVKSDLTIRQAFILTPLSWMTIALFAALPLYFSDYGQFRNSFTNAFFESISGITTTGSTVIVGLDDAPPGVLLWRSLLQWLGGIGIIATAIAIFPALGVGGMQLFRTESSDRSEKVMPRVRQVTKAIGYVYLALTAACALAYWAAGMTAFEALCHALTTISTGGYSTSDSSMGHWNNPALHWLATLFMLSGAIPFVLYMRLASGSYEALRNSQLLSLLGFLAAVITLAAAWLLYEGKYGVEEAFRHAAFNIVSVVTTTGFATVDYSLWGNVAIGVFFGLLFVGGCTGSTAGGMKIFRFEVMALMLRGHFRRLVYPHGLFPHKYGGRALPDDVVSSVVVFFSLYFICYSAVTILLMAHDLDFLTSASASVTALSNVGPGLGSVIGPVGNFSSLPDTAKWLLGFAMLLGRLELFTVLILFSPRFWRD